MLLLIVIAIAGVPAFLLPGPVGIVLSAGVLAGALFADHRIKESVQRIPPHVGAEALPGQSGTVLEPLDPIGLVRCGGEEWRAVDLLGRPIARGVTVRVVRLRGLQLEVEPMEATPLSSPR